MKKILFVANVAKEHVLKFHVPTIKEFSDRGWIVDVACAGDEKIPFVNNQYNMEWKRSPFSLKMISGIRHLRKIIDDGKYDVIYCHTPVGGIAARIAAVSARKQGTKVIYCAHGFHFYKGAPLLNWLVYYPIEKMMASFTDVIYTVNREDFNNARTHFNKRVKVELVPEVGVDFTRLNVEDRVETRKHYREQLRIPDDAFVMIYVAELIKNKNQGMLIDTLKILRDSGKDVYLLLPGPEHDNGYYLEYARNKGVADYCRFLGWRDDIGELMSAADVCTASSIREGFGINLIEAMYCGLPVVATDNRGHEMIIVDQINGFLVRINDIETMASRIKMLIDDDNIRKMFSSQNVSKYDSLIIARQLNQLIAGE